MDKIWASLTTELFPSRWVIYLMLLLCVISFGTGFWVEHKFAVAHEASALVKAQVSAAAAVQRSDTAANKDEKQYLAQLEIDNEAADTQMQEYQRQLALRPAHCSVAVPPDWLRPRTTGLSAIAAAAGKLGQGPASVEAYPTADADAVASTCRDNELHAYKDAVDQVQALRQFYKDQQKALRQ